jgi:hypothetical protein
MKFIRKTAGVLLIAALTISIPVLMGLNQGTVKSTGRLDLVFAKHFESRCDTLTRGTDTIVNCYVRCSNPPLAKDTVWPNGDYKFIEATVTWGSSIDTVKFQTQNKFTGVWYDIGVYDLGTANVPFVMRVNNATTETRRIRIGIPNALKVRAILTSPASYSVRSVHIDWEGSSEVN